MPALYLIAAVIVVIWGAILVLRGSLAAGCLVYIVTAACFGHNFLSFDLGPVPLTLDRIVLVLLVATYVVQRRLGRTDPKPIGRIEIALLVFLGVLIVSGSLAGWHNDNDASGEFSPLFRLIAGYLIPFTLFWIARQTPWNRRSISLVMGTLACLGVYLAVTGLLEIAGQWWAVFPKHIGDAKLGLHFGRARGPMVHSVSYGLYLAVCLLAAWAWRWRFGRAGTLVIVLLVSLMLAGIYFSYTRSVWMGTGLAVMIVLALTLRGSWRPLVLGSMAAAALMIAVTQMDRLVSFKREYSAAETSGSVDLRGSFAYISWQMFLDRPLWGVGFGQFPRAKLPYLSDRSTELNLEATRTFVHHNGLLSVLTETGLIGMTFFLAVLFGFVRSAWLLSRGADLPDWARAQGVFMLGVMAVYVCQLAFHELSYSPIDNSLMFFLAGTTLALRPLSKPCAAPAGAQAKITLPTRAAAT